MSQRNKKCPTCKRWFPATTSYFYATTSRGEKLNQWGEPYLRATCRLCKLEQNAEWTKTNKRRTSPEDRERYRKMQRARRKAYQRLAKINETGFKVLYAEELLKEGIRLDHYVGPTLREDTDRVRISEEIEHVSTYEPE